MAENYKYLLWVDLETTGSNLEKGDEIMEVGVVITDLELREVAEWDTVVTPSPEGLERLYKNDFVFKMHTDNGLLMECQLNHQPIARVDRGLCRWLHEIVPDAIGGDLLTAGSGVSHFDRWFIRKYMPELEARLHYATLDVGVLRRALRVLGVAEWIPDMPESQTGEGKAHRALFDARAHLEEARAYRNKFKSVTSSA